MATELIFSCALTYALLSPVIAGPLYSNLLFYPNYPTRYDAATYDFDNIEGVKKLDVWIPLPDGTRLHGWFFKKPGAGSVCLINHGNASNISNRKWLVDDLLQLGSSVLVYDYRGYGRSTGSASVGNICQDGLAAFDYLVRELGYTAKDVLLFGESLGCAVACNTASQRPCGGLILLSGFSSLRKISGEKIVILRAYPAALFPKPYLDNLAYVKGEHPPVLFIHGELDRTVPTSHSREMFEAASQSKRLVLLPNSGHWVDDKDHLAFMQAVREFMR